ncbi:glycine cleavage system H protein (lipoate-binding) [Levilactobacillus namurensis DSM 19117]|uniref:Glycine cleavage system H protein (Lipoate-binding) n=2 Tax=Levilactobacillus namurensis TaxID=380393 RepID=A0A0R1K7P5_9LACO|nr:glycine cleavage system protein H [Levilactobacillus namurensis]KRK76713.1 glycine cleavage system H protein (lipoate-binding) [Levilactobacillus namurensis DSM 19117]MCW3777864.1 glycine cleavage system protein H [Levilactobacillus namurensis]MDT7014094.1 glycine cleavage system protein H [Levilactobacillus namurensis]MDT7018974.1 glycine cleavage system protein H [Levilactobacillus namurensis]WNN66414.1 glycine cleavage system protein H [Levilactobacillus namurensis]
MSEMVKYFWTKATNDGTRIGLTTEGQDELGTVKFAKLPAVGDQVKKGENLLSVEADKAVSDIPSPVTGKVTAVNPALADSFDALNGSDTDAAWFVDVQED